MEIVPNIFSTFLEKIKIEKCSRNFVTVSRYRYSPAKLINRQRIMYFWLCNHNYGLTMRRDAIHTARIIDFPRRISIAWALAKPWTFICNLMNDTPTRSVDSRAIGKIANSIRRSYSLARTTTQSALLIGNQKSNYRLYEFPFSATTYYKHTRLNRFAILDRRIRIARTERHLWLGEIL